VILLVLQFQKQAGRNYYVCKIGEVSGPAAWVRCDGVGRFHLKSIVIVPAHSHRWAKLSSSAFLRRAVRRAVHPQLPPRSPIVLPPFFHDKKDALCSATCAPRNANDANQKNLAFGNYHNEVEPESEPEPRSPLKQTIGIEKTVMCRFFSSKFLEFSTTYIITYVTCGAALAAAAVPT